MKGNLLFLLCFTFHWRKIFLVQAPGVGGGAFIRRGDFTEGFLCYKFGGLIVGGLIHGGAYFPNFTVYI